jgi:hypothetical protein
MWSRFELDKNVWVAENTDSALIGYNRRTGAIGFIEHAPPVVLAGDRVVGYEDLKVPKLLLVCHHTNLTGLLFYKKLTRRCG